MFAVVRTGGKQYRVAAGDKIVVEKIAGDAGDRISLGDVLVAGDGGELKDVGDLIVAAEIIAQAKADKVIVFKKRRRHNYRRKNGHRQQHTILKILSVGDDRQNEAQTAQPAEAKAAPAPAEVEATDLVQPSTDTTTPAPAGDAAVKAAPKKKAATKKAPASDAPKE